MNEAEIRKSLSGFKGIQSIREIELLRLLDEKDAQIAALSRTAPPSCGACPGDGTICPTVRKLADESPPAQPTYPQNAAKNYIGLDISQAQPTAQASADPLQELVEQAQALDMGYAPNACPTCGKSVSAAPVDRDTVLDQAADLCQNERLAFSDDEWRIRCELAEGIRALKASAAPVVPEDKRDAGLLPLGLTTADEDMVTLISAAIAAAPKETTT